MKTTPFVSVIAERMHTCTACGEAIEIGHLYMRWLVPDSGWSIQKRHPECMDDVRHLYADSDYRGDHDQTT